MIDVKVNQPWILSGVGMMSEEQFKVMDDGHNNMYFTKVVFIRPFICPFIILSYSALNGNRIRKMKSYNDATNEWQECKAAPFRSLLLKGEVFVNWIQDEGRKEVY